MKLFLKDKQFLLIVFGFILFATGIFEYFIGDLLACANALVCSYVTFLIYLLYPVKQKP